MRVGIGRWLTADRIEVIVWGVPPVGPRYWHAVDVNGERYQFDVDGVERYGKCGNLLVQLSMTAQLPTAWVERARKLLVQDEP